MRPNGVSTALLRFESVAIMSRGPTDRGAHCQGLELFASRVETPSRMKSDRRLSLHVRRIMSIARFSATSAGGRARNRGPHRVRRYGIGIVGKRADARLRSCGRCPTSNNASAPRACSDGIKHQRRGKCLPAPASPGPRALVPSAQNCRCARHSSAHRLASSSARSATVGHQRMPETESVDEMGLRFACPLGIRAPGRDPGLQSSSRSRLPVLRTESGRPPAEGVDRLWVLPASA